MLVIVRIENNTITSPIKDSICIEEKENLIPIIKS
jgi:hypothetical protein